MRNVRLERMAGGRAGRLALVFLAALGLIIGALLAPGQARAASTLPCDIYAGAGSPCVAAYSTTRALYQAYSGPLYQVTATSGSTLNVGLLATGGYSNAAAQDSFCAGTTCTITKIYDQSAAHNDLTVSPGGDAAHEGDVGAVANLLPVTVGGHAAYGVYMPPGTGYRHTGGAVTNGAAETMYMVGSGTNVNGACCSDFGNVETQSVDRGATHMDALTIATLNGSTTSPLANQGPWVQADLENGVFQGQTAVNSASQGLPYKFVTALLKNNGQTTFALKGGNATSGSLTTMYSGALPNGYAPMHQEGSIVLGTGGDNSNHGTGSFFEGVMTSGYSTDAADDSVQSNIASVGYSANSTGGGPGQEIVGKDGKCVDVAYYDVGGNLQPVGLSDCDRFAADQHWTLNADQSLTTMGKCLDIAGNSTTGGAKLILWTCNGVGGQKWKRQTDGSLLNPQSGLCLDDPNGNTANGTQLQIWTCNGNVAQKFTFAGVTLNAINGKCLDVAGVDTGGLGASVGVALCTNEKDQHWTFYDDGTVHTLGRCLDIVNNSTSNLIQLWDCNGVAGQQWVAKDGVLSNPGTGKCLDVPNGDTSAPLPKPVQVYTCNGNIAQVFVLG